MPNLYHFTFIACLFSSLVAGQTASNLIFGSTGFQSQPTEVAIPPVAEMIGSVSFFTDFVVIEGTTTKWIHPVSSEIQITRTTAVSGRPAQATGSTLDHSDIFLLMGDDALVLTSPPFRELLEQGYSNTKKCPTTLRLMLRVREESVLCGFYSFLNIAKDWPIIGRFSSLGSFNFLSQSFNTTTLERGFQDAINGLGENRDIGILTPAAYSFLWISWHILGANKFFPPVLRVPGRLFKDVTFPKADCWPPGKVSGESFRKAVEKMCTLNIYNTGETKKLTIQAKNVDATDSSGTVFEFLFQYKSGTCPWNCVDIYARFLLDKMCYNEGMTPLGLLELDCGTVAFMINDPHVITVTGSPPPTSTTTEGRLVSTGYNPALTT